MSRDEPDSRGPVPVERELKRIAAEARELSGQPYSDTVREVDAKVETLTDLVAELAHVVGRLVAEAKVRS